MKSIVFAMVITWLPFTNSANQLPYASKAAENQAVEFAPGIISTEQFEINAVFNQKGDSVIFARCSNDFKKCTMMESLYKHNQWQPAKSLPFSSGKYLEADPYYNEDYSAIYFVSKRPVNFTENASATVNLWRVKKQLGLWQQPEYLKELSANADDLYPSITLSGDLYFPSFRDNQRRMFVAKKKGDGFASPKALPTEMFGEDGKIGDTVVLPDGKTMIISMRRSDSLGKGDLYVSNLVDGEWSMAKSLGSKVNTENHEFTPIVSPDGKYLFFTRIENGVGNIYQIATSALVIYQ